MTENTTVPSVSFRVRVADPTAESNNCEIVPSTWADLSTDEIFNNKKVIVFSLPGAFTPTCSTFQLPGFELDAQKFYDKGVDDIYCISVNDAFVMNAWRDSQNLKNVKVIPDGNGDFTKGMGMDVTFNNRGFGMRSWRYAMIVDNGTITKMFIEPGYVNDSDPDPYGETSPDNVFASL
jgi:peroxiredoxin